MFEENETLIKSTKRPLKRKIISEGNDVIKENALQKAISILEEPVDKEDKFDVFGKYMALQLRSMNEHDSEYLQFKIQEMVFKTKFHQSSSPRGFFPSMSMNNLSSPEMPVTSTYGGSFTK